MLIKTEFKREDLKLPENLNTQTLWTEMQKWLGKVVGKLFKTLAAQLPCSPAALLAVYPREMKTCPHRHGLNAHGSVIHSGRTSAQQGRRGPAKRVCRTVGCHPARKKCGAARTGGTVREPWTHSAKREQPITKGPRLKWPLLYEKLRTRKPIQTENRWVVARGRGKRERLGTGFLSVEIKCPKVDCGDGRTPLWTYENPLSSVL